MDAVMRKYEMMMILKPDLLEKDVEKVFEQVRAHVAECKGTISLEDFWGKRTLAYPIKKQDKGLYAVFYFELDPAQLKALDREMSLEGSILRHLIVKTPDDLTVIEYITILKQQAEQDKQHMEKEMEEKKKQEPKKTATPRRTLEKRPTEATADTPRVEKKGEKELDAHVDQLLGDLDNA